MEISDLAEVKSNICFNFGETLEVLFIEILNRYFSQNKMTKKKKEICLFNLKVLITENSPILLSKTHFLYFSKNIINVFKIF